jgi:hypothetical protein
LNGAEGVFSTELLLNNLFHLPTTYGDDAGFGLGVVIRAGHFCGAARTLGVFCWFCVDFFSLFSLRPYGSSRYPLVIDRDGVWYGEDVWKLTLPGALTMPQCASFMSCRLILQACPPGLIWSPSSWTQWLQRASSNESWVAQYFSHMQRP